MALLVDNDTLNSWLFALICVLLVYLIFCDNEDDELASGSTVDAMTPVKDVPVYRKYTWTELSHFGPDNPDKILIAIEDKVFDVSQARQMYGNGGPYSSFAGSDATYKLARQCTSDAEAKYDQPLSSAELENLRQWKRFYEDKYLVVGELVVSDA